MGLAIVAIPEENDRVWKISSEKVPHLTLLFLGESENADLQTIMQFVEHAVTLSEHGQFYLDVDRRGLLGDADADVLFFNKRSWNLKWIKQFRGQLLQNDAVRTAYDSADQHGAPQEWVPHLTLGYPQTPAKPLGKDDFPIYSVCFDRIAVWADNFEGPEFRLEWPDREFEGDLAIAYSDSQKAALTHYATNLGMSEADVIEHYGKKGMRWGVRNDRFGRDRLDPKDHSVKGDVAKALLLPPGANFPAHFRLGSRAVTGTKAYLAKRKSPEEVAKREKRRAGRRDFFWEMHTYSDISHADVHNKVADEIDSKVYQLQSAPKYRGKNLKADKKLQDEYDQDVAKVTDSAYRRAVKDTYGVNPSGTKKAEYVNDARGARIEIRDLSSGKTLSEKALNPVQEDVQKEEEIGHAATSTDTATEFVEPDIMMTVKTNEQGFITEIGRVKLSEDESSDTAEHGADFVEGFLRSAPENLGEQFVIEHYGVKGMRWGVRNRKGEPVAVTPTATSKVPHGNRRKTKIEAKGGENHHATEDALKVEEARAKLKKSGPKALSNKELKEVAERLRLEEQAVQLDRSHSRVSRGRSFVRKVTGFGKETNDAVNTGFQTAKLAKQVRG